jgi:exodeoxyribonuclease X
MKIADAIFVVIDTETTGLDPKVDQLVEIAAVATTATRVLGMWSTLVNPGILIPPEISAIHGIVDADVAGAPNREAAYALLAEFLNRHLVDSDNVLAAHNAEFDRAFIQQAEDPSPWLCTRRLAQHLWPDYPAYKNQSLRFRRQLQVDTYGVEAHRALGDALVTGALLRDEIASEEFRATGIELVDQAIAHAQSPIIFKTWPFGQYRGQPINVAPRSYVDWALNKMADLSPDMRYTLQRLRAA